MNALIISRILSKNRTKNFRNQMRKKGLGSGEKKVGSDHRNQIYFFFALSQLLLIDCTILYVILITFHGLYDNLSTNIQQHLGQYEKNPSNMEKLSQYEIQPIRCKN